MAHPILTLAERLDRRIRRRRALRSVDEVQRDPHLARDVGLPYRETPGRSTELW